MTSDPNWRPSEEELEMVEYWVIDRETGEIVGRGVTQRGAYNKMLADGHNVELIDENP